jgi:GPH family glycoside/pentoside/hexuronide:cation symporter
VLQDGRAPDQLSFGRKFGFTVGDYACNLYWQSVSIFLLFYYTDVVGLSAGTAGFIYMIASIFDGAIDPFMGALADRTRTRWGRYRPFVLFGGVPLGLSFVGLYYRPALQGAALTAAVLAAHLIFRVCYTTLSIPYTALNARITSSTSERSTVAGFRMIFATLAGLTVSFLTQPLVGRLGHGDAARGFLLTAAVFALVATAIFPIVFAATREPKIESDEAPALRTLDYWRAVAGNRAFWMVMAGITLGVMSSTTLGKALLYYFKYYLHDEAGARYALSLNAALGLAAIPGWVYFTRFVGKRAAWLTAVGWGLAGLVGFAVLGAETPVRATLFFMFMQIASLGVSFTFWSMLPDTVEYGEWRTSLRAESFIFGLGQFFLKAALGLGAGLFGTALGAVGYHPNVPQTAATLEGMKIIIVVLPAVGLIGSAIAMLAYPIRRGVHESIVRDLASRAAARLEPAEVIGE